MLASITLCESLRPLDFESSKGFWGTGGAGFLATPNVDDADDATLDALDLSSRLSLVVLPPLRLLSNETLVSGSNGGGSMRVGPVAGGFGAFGRFRCSDEI